MFLQAHNDDISQILLLNKKSIANYETQLFQSELEKYRPYQNRLVHLRVTNRLHPSLATAR